MSVSLTQAANIFEGVVSSDFSELFEKEMFYQQVVQAWDSGENYDLEL